MFLCVCGHTCAMINPSISLCLSLSLSLSHPSGTGDTVAVMITESYGKELLSLLERNLTVLVSVTVGSRGPPKNINRGSLVFVSISFIVLMIISSAWLIFYFIQKIRDTNARDRSQVRPPAHHFLFLFPPASECVWLHRLPNLLFLWL